MRKQKHEFNKTMISLIILLAIVSKSVAHVDYNHKKLKEQSESKPILKCCDPGYAYSFKDLICVENKNPFRLEVIKININPMIYFHFHYRKPSCSETEDRVVVREVYDENIALGIDNHGNLHIDTDRNTNAEIIEPESFCVDNLLLENDTATWTIFNAIICMKPTTLEYHIINSTCLIISCIFILATVLVYIWLPELNNQHGRILIAYLVCLFIGYSLLATMKMLLYFNRSTKTTCYGLTIVMYFFLLSSFFWQNVMCFDIWRTFSGRGGLMTNTLIGHDKFYSYSVYTFGIPTILTTLLISKEYYYVLPSTSILPDQAEPCFLSGTNRLIYLDTPILVLWVADMTFFISTIAKIWQIKQQTSVLYTGDNATHSRHNVEKQRLFLYIKLFIVMGINWVVEVLSAHAAPDNTIWLYTDACNELIGFFIFIIFVCKRKTCRLMKKRYAQIIGKPVVRNQSSTRTINTSVKITHI